MAQDGAATHAATAVQTHTRGRRNRRYRPHGGTRDQGAWPQETVERFGETYTFSPPVFAVYRDEPTLIAFRNLQPDDGHDFMLVDPNSAVLMNTLLPPLQDAAYFFTSYKEGLFTFYCAMHRPAMSGQILVLSPQEAADECCIDRSIGGYQSFLTNRPQQQSSLCARWWVRFSSPKAFRSSSPQTPLAWVASRPSASPAARPDGILTPVE